MSTDPTTIRSFALVGHGGHGKTSIGEAIALLTGRNNRLGSVADHTAILDFEEEEKKHHHSIQAAFLCGDWDGMRVHVVDTPGDGNFLHEARAALQAVDAAVLVVSAVDGVEVSTEHVVGYARSQDKPCAVFINKMDREYADHEQVLGELKDLLGAQPVLLQLPIGREGDFRGLVDLLEERALFYEGTSGRPTVGDIPEDLADDVALALEQLMEAVAMSDDELIEEYLEHGELTHEQVREGLHKGILSGAVVPVLLGCALRNIGVDQVLSIARAFPRAGERGPVIGHAPGDELVEVPRGPDDPVAALCVKTNIERVGSVSVFRCVSGPIRSDTPVINARTGEPERLGTLYVLAGAQRTPIDEVWPGDLFGVMKLKDTRTGDTLCDPKAPVVLPWIPPAPPMMSYTITPKSRSDVDKMRSALDRLLAEDIGLTQGYDTVTKELVLSGRGTQHVQTAIERLERKYGVSVVLGTPSIPYRESIQGQADVRYRHKKQTGGAGQFGEVAIRVEPSPRGAGFVFHNEIKGGVIPTSLIPSVEKGIQDMLAEGVLAGFPVQDVTVTLYDGKYHPVDSKDIAFQIAGRQAIKEAVMQARPVLLEPIYKVDVVVPEESVGDVMSDLNSRRGRILNMESRGRNAMIEALVPLAEMLSFAPDLRSMTGGKGSFTMEFDSYEQVPKHLQAKVVEEVKRAHAQD